MLKDTIENETFIEPHDKDLTTDDNLIANELCVSEDHPKTTMKEIWGWYLYEIANQPYSTVAISGYLPIMLTDMAKFYAAHTESKCYVPFGAINLLPATFTSAFISASVLIQTILFIFTSSMADYGRMRKRMLIATAFVGGGLTCAFIFMVNPNLYILAGFLLIVTNVLFGYSVVFYNAFLPHLVRSHPDTHLLDGSLKAEASDKLTNKLSANSFMLGHVAGIIVLLISVPIVYFLDSGKKIWYDCSADGPQRKEDTDSLLGLRLSVLIVGVVWIGITIFTLAWLKPRPGPPLPVGKNYLTASVSSVINTLKQIKKLKNTFIFLLAYFIFSDAYNTIASVGILFAKTDLNASSITLVIMLVEVPFVAVIGNLFWLWIKNHFTIETKKMLYMNLCCLLVLPVYGFIGFIPSSPIGIKNIWELYLFGAIYGFNLSAIQSFARSLFIALTPPGKEAEFFGFYELTDKGSAWIGPAIVAVLTQSTGQVRYGFIFLFITLSIPIFILRFVNVAEGTEIARNYGKTTDTLILSEITDNVEEEEEMVSLEDDHE